MLFLPGLDSSQLLLPGHHGYSWLHPMAITNPVLSMSCSLVSTPRPWTSAVETLEICSSESRQVLSCYQLNQLSSALVRPHTSCFQSKPLSMAPIPSPWGPHPPLEWGHYIILQLFCLHTPPLQTTPFIERVFLSDLRRNSSLSSQLRLLTSSCSFNHPPQI